MIHTRRLVSVFGDGSSFTRALQRLQEAHIQDIHAFMPAGISAVEQFLPRRGSPVRFFTIAAGIAGAISGFWMCIGSALLYSLIVGGKRPAALLPYCVIGFELTVLLGGLMTLAAVFFFSRLYPGHKSSAYRPAFSNDKYGIAIDCTSDQIDTVTGLLRAAGAEEIDEEH
jgi:hypothetical protein